MCTRTDTWTLSGTPVQQTPTQTPIQTPISAPAEGVVSGLEQTPIWCSNRPLRELVLERWSRGLLDVLPRENFPDSDLTSSGRRRPSIGAAWRNCSCPGSGPSVDQLAISTPRRFVTRLLFCRVLAPARVSAVSARPGPGSIDLGFLDLGSAHRVARSRDDFSKPAAPLVCKGEAQFRGIGPTFGLVRGAPFSRVLRKRSYLWPGEGRALLGKSVSCSGGARRAPYAVLGEFVATRLGVARWRFLTFGSVPALPASVALFAVSSDSVAAAPPRLAASFAKWVPCAAEWAVTRCRSIVGFGPLRHPAWLGSGGPGFARTASRRGGARRAPYAILGDDLGSRCRRHRRLIFRFRSIHSRLLVAAFAADLGDWARCALRQLAASWRSFFSFWCRCARRHVGRCRSILRSTLVPSVWRGGAGLARTVALRGVPGGHLMPF